jgi:GT2 family glycosyltransferase
MTSDALLGIAIPSYKRPELLARLLDSIDADIPISVSDNGAYLDAAFTARYPRVRFVQKPEVIPVLQNWNRAARAVDSEWIVMPGDDDLYYPGSFDLIERAIRNNPSADILFFGHHIIDEVDRVIGTWSPAAEALAAPAGFERVRLGVPARPPGIVFRKAVYERLGGFCEAFQVTASDNDFYQRVTLVGRAVFVPDVASGYRVWSSGGTAQTIASKAWLDEIDLWCGRVQEFAGRHSKYTYPDSLRDEIYLGNLRAGIWALKARGGYLTAWRHAATARYPYRARLISQLKLLALLVLPRRP